MTVGRIGAARLAATCAAAGGRRSSILRCGAPNGGVWTANTIFRLRRGQGGFVERPLLSPEEAQNRITGNVVKLLRVS